MYMKRQGQVQDIYIRNNFYYKKSCSIILNLAKFYIQCATIQFMYPTYIRTEQKRRFPTQKQRLAY